MLPLFPDKENWPMKKTTYHLFLVVVCLLYGAGSGYAETMYVTDRLYLSIRRGPSLEEPSLAIITSDTRVEVTETEGKWAKIALEDGKKGWVMQRYLVKDPPKSRIIEQLKGQIEDKNIGLERTRDENASLRAEIEELKNQIIQQNARIEMSTKENTLKRLKEIYGTGIVALLVGLILGLILGYLVKRQKRARY
jgi:SH3 domain protein